MKFESPSGHRAEPPPPAEQATTADAAKIGSLPLKGNYESRASEAVLRGCGQGRAVTPPAAPTSQFGKVRREFTA
jgi:hypothetical protein